MVFNGSPCGFFANHSLVMANEVLRANAEPIDLRELLKRGCISAHFAGMKTARRYTVTRR